MNYTKNAMKNEGRKSDIDVMYAKILSIIIVIIINKSTNYRYTIKTVKINFK